MTGNEFAVRLERVIAEAREAGASVEDMLDKLERAVDALREEL